MFGSYVTAKPDPRDVDVVWVMKEDFSLAACDEETRVLFDHQRAEDELGRASSGCARVFFCGGRLTIFFLSWGIKRDLTRRGIVEVTS